MHCSPTWRNRRPTSYSGYSTLPRELFPAHGNSIGVCHASFVMTYTGWMTTRHLQSVHDCLQVPTWLGTAIPRWTVCAGCRCRGAPSAPFCEPGSPRLPSVQHVKLWPTCVLVRRPSCLELAAGIFAPSFIPFRVQTLYEDILCVHWRQCTTVISARVG